MKNTAITKFIMVILVSLIAIIMCTKVSLAMDRPETKTFYSYRTVVTYNLALELKQNQTVYLSYNMTYNGYFKIKKPDNTLVLEVNRLTAKPGSVYLETGQYTIVVYGGDGMANGYSVNDPGITLNITYIKESTGKMVRIIEGTGTFTTNITTTIYYDWSGGNSLTLGSYKLASLQFNGPTSHNQGTEPNPNGSFIGKPGTYTVQCTGGYFTPYYYQTIYVTGSVDIWYDDTKPQVTMDSSKKDQWIKGSSDGSIKADYQISLDTPNSPIPLLVKVFFGPEGQTPTLYKSISYNPATPTNITGNWPVPADVNGRYQAYAELWENNGANLKLKTSDKIYFNIDNTPMALNVTRSPEQAYYSSVKTPVINFEYTASDNGSGFGKVVTSIDGTTQDELLLPNGIYPWTLPNSGQHIIAFTAYDTAGNQSAQTFTINIDNTNPEFPGSLQVSPAPVYLSYVNAKTVTYGWTAVNEEHFREYRIKIESAYLNNPTSWTLVRDWTSTGSSTSYPYTIPTEYNGQMLKATVKAVDLAGNETSISMNIISDQSVPAVTLPQYATRFQTGAAPGAGKVVCRWNPINDNIDGAAGSGSGIAYYELALTANETAPDQGQPLQTATVTGDNYEFFNVSSSNSYYLWVRGIDLAGNTGVWTMSGPFPDFRVSGPENNSTVETASFQATARTAPPDNNELRFQLKTKRTDATVYDTLPGVYQTTEITPSLNYGNWNWYLEMKEYDSLGNPIPESIQTTEVFTFFLENDTVTPVILQPVSTTPGAVVRFSATVAEPERVVSYQWDTGDNHALDGQSPQYSYSNVMEFDPVSQTTAKVYPLQLTVSFTDGTQYTAQTTVTVQNTGNGRLYTNETWQGIHHIYGDVMVPEGITLTVMPGTQVIIEQSPGQTGYRNGLIVNGVMNAGTGVVFQLADGTALQGWKGITISGQALLDQATVCDAERAITTIGTDHVTIRNCAISNNYTGVHVCGGHPAISGTTFRGNTLYAIKEEDGWPVVTNCIFTGNGIDYYHDTLTKITAQQLNALPDRGNEGNQDQD